jgi:hypothetical protein
MKGNAVSGNTTQNANSILIKLSDKIEELISLQTNHSLGKDLRSYSDKIAKTFLDALTNCHEIDLNNLPTHLHDIILAFFATLKLSLQAWVINTYSLPQILNDKNPGIPESIINETIRGISLAKLYSTINFILEEYCQRGTTKNENKQKSSIYLTLNEDKQYLWYQLKEDLNKIIADLKSAKKNNNIVENIDIDSMRSRIFKAILIAKIQNTELMLTKIPKIFHPITKRYFDITQEHIEKYNEEGNQVFDAVDLSDLNDPTKLLRLRNSNDDRFPFSHKTVVTCFEYYSNDSYIIPTERQKCIQAIKQLKDSISNNQNPHDRLKFLYSAINAFINFASLYFNNMFGRRRTNESIAPYQTFIKICKRHILAMDSLLSKSDNNFLTTAKKLREISQKIKSKETVLAKESELVSSRTDLTTKKTTKPRKNNKTTTIAGKSDQKSHSNPKITPPIQTNKKSEPRAKACQASFFNHTNKTSNSVKAKAILKHEFNLSEFVNKILKYPVLESEKIYLDLLVTGLKSRNYAMACDALGYLIDNALGTQETYMRNFKLYHPFNTEGEELWYLNDPCIAVRAAHHRTETLKPCKIDNTVLDDTIMQKAVHYFDYYNLYLDLEKGINNTVKGNWFVT